jgi:hypothetical protein
MSCQPYTGQRPFLGKNGIGIELEEFDASARPLTMLKEV